MNRFGAGALLCLVAATAQAGRQEGRTSVGLLYGQASPQSPASFKSGVENGRLFGVQVRYGLTERQSVALSYSNGRWDGKDLNADVTVQPLALWFRQDVFPWGRFYPYVALGGGVSRNKSSSIGSWTSPALGAGLGLDFFLTDFFSMGVQGLYQRVGAKADEAPYQFLSGLGVLNVHWGETQEVRSARRKAQETERRAQAAQDKAQELERKAEAETKARIKAEEERKKMEAELAQIKRIQAEMVKLRKIVAVLTSGVNPYQNAYRGFVEGFGLEIPVVDLTQGTLQKDSQASLVVAFGSLAASQSYPAETTVICALAPDRQGPRGRFVRIQSTPPPTVIMSKLRDIQPTMKRLAVFWMSEAFADQVPAMQEAGARLGVEVLSKRIEEGRNFPSALRSLEGKADALWLAPDTPLVTPENLTMLREFSWLNDIPFYAPTAELAAKGAVASVSCSLTEIGYAAARAARQALIGALTSDLVYPVKTEIVINTTAAENVGLKIPPRVLEKADKVIR